MITCKVTFQTSHVAWRYLRRIITMLSIQWRTALLYVTVLICTFRTISCQMIDGVPGCRTTKLELVFLVDGSSSVSTLDFNLAKEWINNMTTNFDISPTTTRVAVVQYSSYPRTEFDLDAHSSSHGVLRAINSIQYMSGNTQTGLALRYAIERVFVRARDGSSKVVIVLSDGQSQDEVLEAATALHSSGIATFAVGVGDMTSSVRMQELREISSGGAADSDNVFMVEDFRSIGQIQKRLINAVCEQTVQECPTAKHDLTFLIDGSSTIGYDDFMKVKEWMKKIVNAFDIGPDDTRVAVVQYSTVVQEEFNFRDMLSKEEVLNAIDLMEYMMGDTHTGDALMYMLQAIYSEENGERPDVPDLAIVMTDGKAQEPNLVVSASRAVHEAGITVFAVGVADYSIDEVRVIASDPDENFVIEALNFDIIDLKRVGLIKSICTQSEQTCPTASAELVFLVDGSTSIGSDNFQKVKHWLKSIVDAFQVGPYYTRVAVVQFTETPYLEFGLATHESTQATLQAIQNIRYRRGSTNIGRAIEFTMTQVIPESRDNVPRILIALTDGQSQDDVTAAAGRAREAGVHTLVFGVGNAQPSQLRQMVVQTDNVFQAAGFDEIQRMQSKIVSLICVQSEPECSSQEVDLHFLVDGSDSIGEENFQKVKIWMKNIVRSFDVGKYTTRVALTQFSSTVQTEFDLKRYATKREIEYAIERLSFNGGPTMIAKALNHVRESGFSVASGGREGAPKVLIVISDGRAGESIEEAAVQLHQSGVYVFSVGAGNTWRSAMEIIGSTPVVSHVKDESSYDVINNYRRELVGEICRETRAECPDTEMDLIFLVDGSSSVGRTDFETTKEWMISFVREFEIGEYNTKIGVVQYSSNVRSEIDIGAYENKEELISAINRIQFATGSTNTGSALDYVRSIGFSTRHGARTGVPKVLIILTDGNAQDQVTRAVRDLHRVGVEVYAIGVGRVNMGELNAVTSETTSSNVYHVRNYDSIKTIQSRLLRSVCEKVEPDCGKTATDLMFLVDGSTSVGLEDWQVVKAFMQNVTEKFRIEQDYVRVGVVQYATWPRTNIEMGDYNGKDDLRGALSNMEWQIGNTYTARALRYVLRSYEQVPPRENVAENKLLIVITDGQPQDKLEVLSAVRNLHNDGWRIFAIGIGQAVLSELGVLASNPDSDHVFYANNYNSTKKFQGRLARLICSDPRYENRPEPTDTPFDNLRNVLSAQSSLQANPLRSQQGRQTTHQRGPSNLSVKSSRSGRMTNQRNSQRDQAGQVSSQQNANIIHPSPVTVTSATASSAATSRTQPGKILINPSNTSSCPVLWRDGKKVTGIDFMEALGVRKSLLGSTATLIKTRPGTQSTFQSLRLKQGTIPVTPFESLLTSGLPAEFSLVSVFRMHARTIKDTWTLMSVTAGSGTTLFSLSFDGQRRSLYISRTSSAADSSAKTAFLDGPLVASLFDRSFHKLELLVDSEGITVMIDCLQVPTRLILNSISNDFVRSTTSFVTSRRRGTTVDIQDLTLKCGVQNVEECCEMPGKKCSFVTTNFSEKTCGCLPDLKSQEVREAEEAEVTKLATRIANEIVNEKLNKLMALLDVDPNLLDATDEANPTRQSLNKRSTFSLS